MPSSEGLCPDTLQNLSLAMERALNEQLFASGAITEELYKAARDSFDKDDNKKQKGC